MCCNQKLSAYAKDRRQGKNEDIHLSKNAYAKTGHRAPSPRRYYHYLLVALRACHLPKRWGLIWLTLSTPTPSLLTPSILIIHPNSPKWQLFFQKSLFLFMHIFCYGLQHCLTRVSFTTRPHVHSPARNT